MSESLNIPFTSRTGGFRIESTLATLEAASDPRAHDDENHSLMRTTLRWVIPILCGAAVVANLYLATSATRWTLLLILLAFPAFFLIARRLVTAKNIRCTPKTLQVIQVKRGKLINSWTFPREKVGPISYVVFSTSRYSSICGLQFFVQSERIRVLSGLEIIEAQLLLNELSRLGYEVVRDIAMPMAVEIARERRRSIFR